MNITSTPNCSMHGVANCPGDKSISQRVLMIASLINDQMKIRGFLHANDPLCTLSSLNQIGANIEIDKNGIIRIKKRNKPFLKSKKPLDLGNSGTGLRLMLGMTSGLGLELSFQGDKSLSSRPMGRVIKPLIKMGVNMESLNEMLPIKIFPSKLKRSFIYELPIASAQVKSCILLAGLASGNSVTVIEPIQSRDHTERMLKNFGVKLEINSIDGKNVIHLNEGSSLHAKDYQVVGDISSASFLIVGALISKSKKLKILDVGMNPTRTGILKVLDQMGANIDITNLRVESGEPLADIVVHESQLKGVELRGSIIPNIIDEIPIISIAAAFAEGETIIRDASELRVKESDRLRAISAGFNKLGVKYENFDDGIKIYGNPASLVLSNPISIDSYDDHRIAMSFLIAGLKCNKPITVTKCMNIFTSFPNFIELTSSLGYQIEK